MPIIDLHADTIVKMYETKTHLRENTHHIDLNKLKAGNYAAQWFALFIEKFKIEEPLMDYIIKIYDYFLKELEENKDQIGLATDFTSYKALRAEGKIAAFLSLEEGEPIYPDLAYLDQLVKMGVRMMTLTWNEVNHLGAPHSERAGLTTFGKEVVDYLNNQPVLVDISHLSEVGVRDIEEIYRGPIMASHCDAHAIYRHSRNLSDEVIRLIADRGGIIGLNFYSYFLNGTDSSRIDDLIRHVAHFYQIGGQDILALGTDFDGIHCKTEVCNASEMGILVDRLSRTYSMDFVEALCRGNAERLIKENL